MAKKMYSDYVKNGTDMLLPILTDIVEKNMKQAYKEEWWNEILKIFYNKQPALPVHGTDEELIDSLDFARCIKIMQWRWNEAFDDFFGANHHRCRNYVHELLDVRNTNSHIGRKDIPQRDAERMLDTMYRLCDNLDKSVADQIKEVYLVVRNGGNDHYLLNGPSEIDVPTNVEVSDLPENIGNNLKELIGTDVVKQTTLTKKISLGGKEQAYPIYKVRLDYLYYNDQNDRVGTWISRYCAENGIDSLSKLERDEYNAIVENFVYESNPDAIKKTQKNILRYGRREAGVTLSDGRIVDGNRRFTCLRRIDRDTTDVLYFETVLLDVDAQADKKQIKMLELAIQHGEEKKVDYDLIDYAIGTYKDIELSHLLTIEEYANSTEESISEVQKRIDIARIIVEFMDYIRLPERYYIAREYQVYSVFDEMLAVLNKLSESDKIKLKTIVFNNILLQANRDQRKFIRDIKSLVNNETYVDYFLDQDRINTLIHEKYDSYEVSGKADLDDFARENAILREKLKNSIDNFIQLSKDKKALLKPIENVTKSVSLMADVDENTFTKMNADEKNELLDGIDRLTTVINEYGAKLGTDNNGQAFMRKPFTLAISHLDMPIVLCKSITLDTDSSNAIILLSAYKEMPIQNDICDIKVFIVNSKYKIISEICKLKIVVGEESKCEIPFIEQTDEDYSFLVIQYAEDKVDEAIRFIPMEMN